MPKKRPPPTSPPDCSVVGSVILPLRVEDTFPVVGFVGPPHVCVNEDLHVSTKEVRLGIEDLERLRPAHNRADDAANDWRRSAPPVGLPSENVEGGAVLRIYDLIANNLAPNTQRGPDWGALVRNREDLPSTGLAQHHVDSLEANAQQPPAVQLVLLHARGIPNQGGKNRLGGVLPRRLGPDGRAASGG